MMVVSMTGYGHSNILENEINVSTEIKTVNHRFSEVNIRLPKELSILEEEIKRIVMRNIRRGKADVFIQIEAPSIHNENLVVKWDLLDQYMQAISNIENRYQMKHHLSMKDLLALPDLFEVRYERSSVEQLKPFIIHSVQEALKNLDAMRKTEGISLKKDIKGRLSNLDDIMNQFLNLIPEQSATYRARLLKLLSEMNESIVDEQRIVTEVALFADKINVDEELTRLKSHVEQFREILEENGTIGRKLDFLLQEMNREINTIGAKSNHLGVSKNVVEVKSEIEKLREQVQNLE
jgi:uncharacterized protein (TIGR00255 family)